MNCPHTALNPLNAAQSSDPEAMQAFYRSLSSAPGIRFDPELALWLVGAEWARAALQHPDLGVRPPEQPLPAQLQGRQFGRVFSHWLRMRDDPAREAEKLRLQAALQSLDAPTVQAHAQRQAALALPQGWDHWQWASLPATVASLLGLDMADSAAQMRLRAQLQTLAAALKPGADAAALDAADAVCTALSESLGTLADAPLWRLLCALPATPEWAETQALALLWQGFEAGAALLGQGLLAAHAPKTEPTATACLQLLTELSHAPGAIHHTRRWARQDCEFAGQPLRRGDALLLILAGSCEQLGFGAGRHACPGQALSLQIGSASLLLALTSPPGACAAEGGDSERWPRRGQFLPDLQPHSPAMGQKDGVLAERRSQKWTGPAALHPPILLPRRLLSAYAGPGRFHPVPNARIPDLKPN